MRLVGKSIKKILDKSKQNTGNISAPGAPCGSGAPGGSGGSGVSGVPPCSRCFRCSTLFQVFQVFPGPFKGKRAKGKIGWGMNTVTNLSPFSRQVKRRRLTFNKYQRPR
jgi:hypothetical protein